MKIETKFNLGEHVFIWKENAARERVIEEIIVENCADITKGRIWPCINYSFYDDELSYGENLVGRTPEEARLFWSIAYNRQELGENVGGD